LVSTQEIRQPFAHTQRAIKMRDDMPVLYSNLGYAYFSRANTRFHRAFRTAWPKIRSSSSAALPERFRFADRSVPAAARFYFCWPSPLQKPQLERAIFYLRKSKEEGYAPN